jgi:Tfp pilus assembly protein PilN
MLKINLLPSYVNQRSKIRAAWTAMALLLVAELAGATVYQAGLVSQEGEKLTVVQKKEHDVTEVQKLASEASKERAKIAPIKAKTSFIKEIRDYNRVRPDLFDHVASYIYKEVWITGMQAETNTLSMPASAKSVSSVGRFLLFMQNNPDFTQVRISSVPGWPPGTAGVEASAIGGDTGEAAPKKGPGTRAVGIAEQSGPPAGMMGPGGPMGSMGPMGPGMMPGGPPGGGMMGPGGPGGGAPGLGSPGGTPQIFGSGATGAGGDLTSVPTPGTEGYTTGGAPIPYPTSVTRPKLLPVYFPFTVTGVLAKPIARPNFNAPSSVTDEDSDIANGKLPAGYSGVAGK